MTQEATLRDRLRTGEADLIVDLYLYPTDAGGRAVPIRLGFGCPCVKDDIQSEAWSGYPLLEEEMGPGERLRVGFVFLLGKLAVEAFIRSEKFYLWDGRTIGEASIVR